MLTEKHQQIFVSINFFHFLCEAESRLQISALFKKPGSATLATAAILAFILSLNPKIEWKPKAALQLVVKVSPENVLKKLGF